MPLHCSWSECCHLLPPCYPPISKHCHAFQLGKKQPQQQLTLKTLESVSQAYSLSQPIIPSYCHNWPFRNCHTSAFWGALFSLQFWQPCFPHHPSGYDMACSRNVLKMI